MIAIEPKAELGRMFDAAGGAGKPRIGQVPICYGDDEARCRKLAYEQWRFGGLPWTVNAELPEPRSFAAVSRSRTEDEIAQLVPCGPDLDRHVAAVRAFLDAGYTHVALVQVGACEQDAFLDFAGRQLLPALRASRTRAA
jgi:G6PDH family F420-dependent oxidoreductase